jgi:hypothetical protein
VHRKTYRQRCGAPNCWLLVVAASAVFGGCTESEPTVPPANDTGNLRGIARVYSTAHRNLGRPPQSVEELKQVLGRAMPDPSSVFRSHRDGEEYVIVWGLDLLGRDFNSSAPLAYEKKGVEGKRLVVDCRGEVTEITNAEFAKLKFPKGHKPVGG